MNQHAYELAKQKISKKENCEKLNSLKIYLPVMCYLIVIFRNIFYYYKNCGFTE